VPKDFVPRFYYLWLPTCFQYPYNGYLRQDNVPWTFSDKADWRFAVDLQEGRPQGKAIPVVKLSTWFADGLAAMVWPADNRTGNLFLQTHPIRDTLGALSGKGYEMARFVKPEFIRVLQDPFDFEPSG